MANRKDVYRRETKVRGRKKGKSLTTSKMWQVAGGLFLIFTTFAALLWLMGVDFNAEYRRTPWFSISTLIGAERRGMRLTLCGVARGILPESIEDGIPCAWWNLSAFYIIPAIALAYAVKSSVSRA